MLNENFVFLGILINAIGLSSYLIDTVKGKVKPNKISFALWSLPPLIAFLAQIKQGVGMSSIMTLSVSLFPLIIFLGSFINKKAYWKLTKFDLTCGGLSLLAFLIFYFTKTGNVALLFSILADGLPYFPVIIKAYKFPETESAWPWFAVSMNGLITLLTIKTWNFASFSFPLYFLIINFIVFAVVKFRIKSSS